MSRRRPAIRSMAISSHPRCLQRARRRESAESKAWGDCCRAASEERNEPRRSKPNAPAEPFVRPVGTICAWAQEGRDRPHGSPRCPLAVEWRLPGRRVAWVKCCLARQVLAPRAPARSDRSLKCRALPSYRLAAPDARLGDRLYRYPIRRDEAIAQTFARRTAAQDDAADAQIAHDLRGLLRGIQRQCGSVIGPRGGRVA